MPKINNIQVLRAIAAICVIYFHTEFTFLGLSPFGFFGVHLFFVISGFIMAMILARDDREFFRRRLIRILPPYWTATLGVFAVSLVAPALLRTTRPEVAQLVKSLLFIPFRKENGFIHPTLFQGWTLNCEMFFYAVIGMSLLISRKSALVLTAIVIIGTVITSNLAATDVIHDFYGNPILLEFLAGLLIYRLYSIVSVTTANSLRAGLGIAALIAFFALVAFEAGGAPDTPWLTLKLGSAAVVLVSAATLLSRAGFDTNWYPIILVGDASYVLYLIHPFVQYTLEKTLGARVPWLSAHRVPGLFLALAVPIGVAVLVHVQLERPFTKFLSRRLLSRAPAVGNVRAVAAG